MPKLYSDNDNGGIVMGLVLITLHLTENSLAGLEELVRRGMYPNKSEAIRIAIRDFLNSELPISRSPSKKGGEG
jgi:antitoxin ParD1/3/4